MKRSTMKMRRLRKNIFTFINEPTLENFCKIRYYCDSGRIETAPCMTAKAYTWNFSRGKGHGCDCCPLNVLHGPYISLVGLDRNCAMIYSVFGLSVFGLDAIEKYWDEHQGDILLAFTRFSLGIYKDKDND